MRIFRFLTFFLVGGLVMIIGVTFAYSKFVVFEVWDFTKECWRESDRRRMSWLWANEN